MIFLLKKFFSGNKRSVLVKKNILASVFLKGISILINLLLVPLIISYLNPENYGVWLTLSSIIGWFNIFDLGLGNGLRNKFAEAQAIGDIGLAKKYVSTTYTLIAIIATLLLIAFSLIAYFLNWNSMLNTSIDSNELTLLVFIVFVVFCFQFVAKLINTILVADQRPALSTMINTIASLISLIIVYILLQHTKSSIFYLGTSLSLANLIVPLVATFFFFGTIYKKFRPSIKLIDFSYTKDLMSLGTKFFIMQGAAMIVFMTDNFIIAQISGPEEVTVYNVAHKYFGVIMVFFTIITTPLWSASTDAFVQNDLSWIKRAFKRIFLIWLFFCVLGTVMLIVSNDVYSLWLGKAVQVPFTLSLTMACYVLMASCVIIFATFLSGIGKIKLSIYHSVLVSIINIPLSIFFANNLEFGSTGVIMATCVGVVISLLFQPIQFFKIINGTATSLWNQ